MTRESLGMLFLFAVLCWILWGIFHPDSGPDEDETGRGMF